MASCVESGSGVITALAPSRRQAGRIDVSIDGVKVLQLTESVVAERGLQVGQAVTPDEVAALDAAERLARATDRALAFLSYRPRSAKEVRDRLHRHGIDPDLINAVLARLAGWGYVGDENFAAYWVENRATHQPRGKRLIEQELRRKGVDRETIADALGTTTLDEAGAAFALASSRLGRLEALDEQTQRRRLTGFLLRRGYDYSTVRSTLDTLLAGAAPNEAEPGDALSGNSDSPLDSDSYAFDGDDCGRSS